MTPFTVGFISIDEKKIVAAIVYYHNIGMLFICMII